MNVLLGCEHSGIVREEFRRRGHNAWSCDILPSDDDSIYHYQGDVLDILDGLNDTKWDLGIFFPPCTHLAVSGAHLFKKKVKEQAAALDFVRSLLHAPIPKIALENPVGIISSRIRKPTQIVQPYHFGHDASKKTCLWLEGLPPLRGTKVVEGRYACINKHVWPDHPPDPFVWTSLACPTCGEMYKRRVWGNQTPSGQNKLGPSDDRWKKRSQTYRGIAEAMAEQWGVL